MSEVIGIVIAVVSLGKIAPIRPSAPRSGFSDVFHLDIAIASFSDMDLGELGTVTVVFSHEGEFVDDEVGKVAGVFAASDGRGSGRFRSASTISINWTIMVIWQSNS
ncbi:MAG: hypothetical protein IPK84_04775 [Candidatus Moraniibacteriota bacterium]|nr:MAG: hypothetical protein IPK84_04775 [Candidatus Moranbacteria bacterium]